MRDECLVSIGAVFKAGPDWRRAVSRLYRSLILKEIILPWAQLTNFPFKDELPKSNSAWLVFCSNAYCHASLHLSYENRIWFHTLLCSSPPSKMSGTVSNLSVWDVTALMGEEEKDVHDVLLYFCVILQRGTGGDFRDRSVSLTVFALKPQ